MVVKRLIIVSIISLIIQTYFVCRMRMIQAKVSRKHKLSSSETPAGDDTSSIVEKKTSDDEEDEESDSDSAVISDVSSDVRKLTYPAR